MIRVPRVEVSASRSDFEFIVLDAAGCTNVQGGIVESVRPTSHRRGIRNGDRMKSIDGKQEGGFVLEEFLAG